MASSICNNLSLFSVVNGWIYNLAMADIHPISIDLQLPVTIFSFPELLAKITNMVVGRHRSCILAVDMKDNNRPRVRFIIGTF